MQLVSTIATHTVHALHVNVAFVILAFAAALPARGQEFKATRFELSGAPWDGLQGAVIGTREVIPLVIAHTAPIPQPVRFLVGANAGIRALEFSGTGESLIRGPVAVGPLTGTLPLTQVHIADVSSGGRGLAVSLRGVENSVGLLVDGVGNSASDHGGIVVSAASNGMGTGVRLGGPVGSDRSSLSTGIDITGGTGLRYNALYQGNGTAIEIGGTLAPNRGVNVYVSGGDQVGVAARANTLGTGVIGASASSSYADQTPMPGTGILGFAATNSNASSDSAVAIRGRGRRGGNGSRGTTTIGVYGDGEGIGVQHSGTVIGVLGTARNTSPGVAAAIGGAFTAEPGKLALATVNGDVHLGSRNGEPPTSLMESTLAGDAESITYMHGLAATGSVHIRSRLEYAALHGNVNIIDAQDHGVVVVAADQPAAEVHGVEAADDGRVVIMVAITDGVILRHASPLAQAEDGVLTAGGVDLGIPVNGAVTLWYDGEEERWRVVGTSW